MAWSALLWVEEGWVEWVYSEQINGTENWFGGNKERWQRSKRDQGTNGSGRAMKTRKKFLSPRVKILACSIKSRSRDSFVVFITVRPKKNGKLVPCNIPWWLYSTTLTNNNMAVDCPTFKISLCSLLRTDDKPMFMRWCKTLHFNVTFIPLRLF
jgi:hypothetical protein